ncbi:MAG: hypothetical protein Q9222_006271 [Ikaeria aurantiellina]
MFNSVTKPRVIVVAGTTGTGKSQLAVTLAEKFNGEIINGDALQLYEGLPIATNKLPLEERKSIPHHLLGCVALNEEPWTVAKYVRTAIGIARDVVGKGKLPIIVGGTHYYTQSLLFESSLVNSFDTEHLTTEAQEKRWPILAASTKDMLKELHDVDPITAVRWHPNDRRKIRHSLEVYLTSGRKPSELYHEQRQAILQGALTSTREISNPDKNDPGDLPSQLRFDPMVLWIHADMDELSPRLDRRVDEMLEAGLVDEVYAMQQYVQKQEESGLFVDQSSGLCTAIGFKELIPYATAYREKGHTDEVLKRIKREGIERTKIATRQYAKRQQKWIQCKLLRAFTEHNVLNRIVCLDGTNPESWQEKVETIAKDVASAFLKGHPLPRSANLSDMRGESQTTKPDSIVRARHCEVCDITLMTQDEWDSHPKSKKHRKATRAPKDWQALGPKTLRNDAVSWKAHLSANG